MRTQRKLKIWIVAAVVMTAVVAASFLWSRPEVVDARFNGAYAFESGERIYFSPREPGQLRYRLEDGRAGVLWRREGDSYEGGNGWSEREPVVHRVTFTRAQDEITGGEWRADDGVRRFRKLPLAERIVSFASGDLTLRGKLVTPSASGDHPVIVLVHGSEDSSAVDYYFEPYFYAANGFAAFAFDKRGTGESEGEYLQNFEVLAGDVIAAVRWLRDQEGIDDSRINLAGFSQGGWIAPLAALKDGGIRSILVGYGVTLPVTAEDRWGYVYRLQQRGFGDAEIAAADRINAIIADIMDRRLDRWSELDKALDAVREEPWFDAIKGSDSALGFISDTKMPMWLVRLYAWWRFPSAGDVPYIDRLYDPVPTLTKLNAPSLWLFAAEDSSGPTAWSIAELDKLKSAGRPVEYRLFPDTDHGILLFTTDEQGERRYTGYHPDYWRMHIDWFQRMQTPQVRFTTE